MAYNLEEQESIDNLKGWWEKWGTPVLVVITLACVGVAGYNGWKCGTTARPPRLLLPMWRLKRL